MVKVLGKTILNSVGVEAGCRSGETPEEVTERRWWGYHGGIWRKNIPDQVPKGISSVFLFLGCCWLTSEKVYNAYKLQASLCAFPYISLNSQQMTSPSLCVTPMGIRCKSLWLCIYFQGPPGDILLPSKRLDLCYARHHTGMSACPHTTVKPESVY